MEKFFRFMDNNTRTRVFEIEKEIVLVLGGALWYNIENEILTMGDVQ